MAVGCSACGACGTLRPCVCGGARYCGAACQRLHWTAHKPTCSPFVVCDIPGKGRGLRATRRLPRGTRLLQDRPLLVIPGTFRREAPDDGPFHAAFRAALGALSHAATTALLALYRDTKSPVLLAHSNSDCDSEVCGKAMVIFTCNAIGITRDGEERSEVYPVMSRLNHSCAPNVKWSQNADGGMDVAVVKEVSKGEELTSFYYPKVQLSVRSERQATFLHAHWNFACACQLCSLSGDELAANDSERLQIQAYQRALEGEVMNYADHVSALEAADAELSLMMSCRYEAYNAMLEGVLLNCYEVASYMGVMSAGQTDAHPEKYKAQALKWATIAGSLAKFHERVQKVDTTIKAIMERKR